jgi:uncharacterized protein with HEPN domain
MKQHDITQCLVDILTSIDDIDAYLTRFMGERRDFKIYMADKVLRRSVERELEIIGEATNRIMRTDPSFVIENARKIVATRNRVIHGYDKIEDETIWAIATRQLPALRAEVERLLG